MEIDVTNTITKINFTNDRQATVNKIYRSNTLKAPGYRYTYEFRSKQWDGNVCLLNENKELLTGLVTDLYNNAETVAIQDCRNIPVNFRLNSTNVNLRDYQVELVEQAFSKTVPGLGWFPRGVIRVATGGGKTEIAIAMYEMTGVPTLFLVHTKDLLSQTINRFKMYGITAGKIGDGKFDTNHNVIVCTMQTLDSILKRGQWQPVKRSKYKDKSGRWKYKIIPEHHPTDAQIEKLMKLADIFETTEQVFFDEAHIMAANIDKGNTFIKIANMLPNAYMRWGLTATPFMRDEYSNRLLKGVTGDLLCDISNQVLIDKGYLTRPIVKIDLNQPKRLPIKIRDWNSVYEKGIVLNNDRNTRIVQHAKNELSPCLILTNLVSHANELHRLSNFPVISGETPLYEREETAHKLKTGQIKTVIANKVWDVGVDIPELRTVILAGGGKSQVQALQRIGRSLRLAKGKQVATIIDFDDTHHRFLKAHGKLRRHYWENEGFEVKEVH